ncbi:unnamed protein product [Schistocephalus solidus]|uniref:Uncharacterized protein n=1 Tax=Schistocephalus solidus TaxID=70667 RepID=A0A183TTP4_SCHSO|nr:unnamed protein product [Schistocephalus solidus]
MRLQLQPRRRPQGKSPPGKLNTLLVNLPAHYLDFSNQITQKLENLHAPDNNSILETRWCQLRNVIKSTALEVLERARRLHQDWFDDNDADISNLLAEKNGLHKAYMDLRTDATKAAFFRCSRLVQQRLRKMPYAWMEIQGHADHTEKKNFLKATKTQQLPSYTVLIVTARAHHISAWSVTCESMAQRPMNRRQEHQHTPTEPD